MRVIGTLIIVALLLASLSSLWAEEQEPGTGFATALPLTSGTYDFYMEVGGTHFFKVKLETGQTLYVFMRPPQGQDFDLVLLTPEREVVEQSIAPAGAGERVSIQAPYTGYYYVVVYSYMGSEGLYTLTIRVVDQPTKTMTLTTTRTERIYVYRTEPTVIFETITETVYLTRTRVEIMEVEKVPWLFLGLVSIGVLVFAGLLALSASLKEKSKESPT